MITTSKFHKFYSWGRVSHSLSKKITLDRSKKFLPKTLIIGKSYSYGDCCQNNLGNLYQFDQSKIINFDKVKGSIVCQSGITIKELHENTIPFGWMIPVSPGCENISLGGAVANDVHGKNFHVFSSFGNHIRSLVILKSNGKKYLCNRKKNSKLFKATIGGVGLTGMILEIEFQLRKINTIYTDSYSQTFSNINQYLKVSDKFDKDYEFSAAWVDFNKSSKGRGVIFGSNFSKQKYLPKKYVKKKFFDFPKLNINFVNNFSASIFSKIYYWKHKLTSKKYTRNTIFDVLYPLDKIGNWNNIYGKNGFYQIQASCPKRFFVRLYEELSSEISKFTISPLAVIKIFNKHKSIGLMSFPVTGHITIAIDIPNKNLNDNFFSTIESIVEKNHGRFYLAKDNFMSKKFFYKSYKNTYDFLKYKDKNISSSMFERIF